MSMRKLTMSEFIFWGVLGAFAPILGVASIIWVYNNVSPILAGIIIILGLVGGILSFICWINIVRLTYEHLLTEERRKVSEQNKEILELTTELKEHHDFMKKEGLSP